MRWRICAAHKKRRPRTDAFELRAVWRALAIFFARTLDRAAALLAFRARTAIATAFATEASATAPTATTSTSATLVAVTVFAVMFAARFIVMLVAALMRSARLITRIGVLEGLATAAILAVETTTAASATAAMTATSAVFAVAIVALLAAAGGRRLSGLAAAKEAFQPTEEAAGFFRGCGCG